MRPGPHLCEADVVGCGRVDEKHGQADDRTRHVRGTPPTKLGKPVIRIFSGGSVTTRGQRSVNHLYTKQCLKLLIGQMLPRTWRV